MQDVEIKLNPSGFRSVMRSAGVAREVGYLAERAKYRAELVSGLRFGCGVDYGPVSAHGWVGARTSNKGLLARMRKALSQSLYGV